MSGATGAATALTEGWWQLVNRLQRLPRQRIHRALCLIAILWILYSLSQLTWLLIAPADSNNSAAVMAAAGLPTSGGAAGSVDVAKLQALNLFGSYNASAAAVQETPKVQDLQADVGHNAAKTRLALDLEGIVYSSIPSEGRAVIVHKNEQDIYKVGDKLPVGNKVSLARVDVDHVILDNNGRYESLWLYDDVKNASIAKARSSPAQQASSDLRDNAEVTALARDYRERVYKNPASLAKLVRITPHQVDGQLKGYRVSPGRDRAKFSELGFQTSDVVTAINGIQLDDPAKALEVYKIMRSAKEANFTVQRGDQSLDFSVSLGDDE